MKKNTIRNREARASSDNAIPGEVGTLRKVRIASDSHPMRIQPTKNDASDCPSLLRW